MLHLPRRIRRARRAAWAATAVVGTVAAMAVPLPVHAQAQVEATLKAKLTLSLTRFAQWPSAGGGDPLQLCVAQRDPAIARAFEETDGLLVNGRRIQVVKAPPTVGCHVLFVHSSAERAPDLIRAAARSPVLIVGDADGMLALGGMVEFVSVNDAIRFDVNLAALRQGQLTVSSQVLKLARQVQE